MSTWKCSYKNFKAFNHTSFESVINPLGGQLDLMDSSDTLCIYKCSKSVKKQNKKKHQMCLTFHNYHGSLGRHLNADDYFVWLLILCVHICIIYMCVCPEWIVFYDAIMTLTSVSSCTTKLYTCPYAHLSHSDLNQLKLTLMYEAH